MRIPAALMLCAGLACSAQAAPDYFAGAGALSGQDEESLSQPFPVSASAQAISTFTVGGGEHLGLGTWSGDSTAHAGRGYLQASSRTSINITDHQASLANAAKGGGGHARFSIEDVLISGPGSGTISGTLNLHFEGSLGASAHFANAIGSAGSYGQVSISVALPGFSGSGGARLGASAPPANSLTLTNSGLLSGYGEGLLALHIDSTSLPLNTPFAITLDLQTETLAAYSVGGTGGAIVPIGAEGVSSFTNTFSFATSGAVFTLPEGYTANSSSGMIVDNRFVPEPSNFALLSAGLCAWFWRSRRVIRTRA